MSDDDVNDMFSDIDVDDSELNENDWKNVCAAVSSISTESRELAKNLGLKQEDIASIIAKFPLSDKNQLSEVIKYWLQWNFNYQKEGKPSWKTLAKAVYPINRRLGESIAQKHKARGGMQSGSTGGSRKRSRPVDFTSQEGDKEADNGGCCPQKERRLQRISLDDSSPSIENEDEHRKNKRSDKESASSTPTASAVGVGFASLGEPVQIAKEWNLLQLQRTGDDENCINGKGITIVILDSAVYEKCDPLSGKTSGLRQYDCIKYIENAGKANDDDTPMEVDGDMVDSEEIQLDEVADEEKSQLDVNNYHGTVCATIAAGALCETPTLTYLGGVAPAATLICYRVSRDGKKFEVPPIVAALKHLLSQENVGKGYIISMSFGFEQKKKDIAPYIDKLTKRGVVCVAAAGNEGRHKPVMFPAFLSNVISVGSCKSTGQPSDFNNKGNIDVYAPGENLVPDQSKGTSYAAPAVAGIIALLMQQVNKLVKSESEVLSNHQKAHGDEVLPPHELTELICDIDILKRILNNDLKARGDEFLLAPHELLKEGPKKLEEVIKRHSD